jgi:hypothetical protein
MFNAKSCFLTNFEEYATIMQGASPEFSILGEKWVAMLYILFRAAHSLAETATMRRGWPVSRLSEEEDKKIVAEVNSARDEALTYENFMAAIGEENLEDDSR